MGTFETVVLTIGIVVIDLLVLNEYLRLEEELRKLKTMNEPSPVLSSIAEQVVEPLPQEAIQTENVEIKSDVERENERLKAEKEVIEESRKQAHLQQLDEIGDKIDEIADSVKSTKEKVVQFS